ncbi:MAG: hypothetical protein WAT39_04890 [Planctomycetota bacterium]
MLRSILVVSLGSVLLAQAREPGLAASQQAVLERTAARYDSASWARGARRAGLLLGALELRGYTGGEIERLGKGPVQRTFADGSGEARLRIEVHVAERPEDAQRQLLGWLAHISSPGLVPPAAGAGIPVGDVGFVGWSKPAERRIAWLAFVRDNLAVRVHCLDPGANPHPDLAAVAQAVDAAIVREPVLAKDAPLPRPVIARLQPAAASCKAGQQLALQVEVVDPAGAPTLKFEFDGPGQGYVEQDGPGRWRLCTTGAGKLTVRLEVTGARGVSVTATTQIDVGPR